MIQPVRLPYRSLAPWLSDDALALHYLLYEEYVSTVVASGATTLQGAVERAAESQNGRLLHAAQQAQNHELYFRGMKPDGGGVPAGRLLACFQRTWDNEDAFRQAFTRVAMGIFGSGWVWMVCKGGLVHLIPAPDSAQPWERSGHIVLVCDVWEHAWIPTYGPDRLAYVTNYLDHLVDWRSAERLLGGA